MCTQHPCANQGRTVVVIGSRARVSDPNVWITRIQVRQVRLYK